VKDDEMLFLHKIPDMHYAEHELVKNNTRPSLPPPLGRGEGYGDTVVTFLERDVYEGTCLEGYRATILYTHSCC
jgi:hypothetical protein